MKIKLYTTDNCPFCLAAKNLLSSRNLDFTEINLTNDLDLRLEISTKHNWKTVPLILIDDKLIGGFDNLKRLNDDGKLF